jgi:hypothetical protein
MLKPPQKEGKGKRVTFRRKKQVRNKRRLLESVDHDWARWDAAAKAEGLNWSEWARRSLNAAVPLAVVAERAAVLVACAYCDHAPSSHFPEPATQTRGPCIMPGCDCSRYQAKA